MKFPSGALGKTWFGVAPLVGAWIEIYGVETTAGTKPVAPLVGAWIEIINVAIAKILLCVAPLVGAWIEIKMGRLSNFVVERRSPRGSVD